MLIEASSALTVRLPSGEVHLIPGQPMEFSEADALKLLAKAKGRVRLVVPSESLTIEPAHPQARPVFWQRSRGEILGPAQPEFLARVGSGLKERYWVVALYEGLPVWINSDRLRSRKAFEQQRKPQVIELVKELR